MDFISNNFEEIQNSSMSFDFLSLMDLNNNPIDSELNSLTLSPTDNDNHSQRTAEEPLVNGSVGSVFDPLNKLCSISDQGFSSMSSFNGSIESTNHQKTYSSSVSTDNDCHQSHDCHHCYDNNFSKDLKKIKRIGKKLGLLSGKKGPFSEKKLAHATAESRYRSSINDQIKRLKTLVAGPNANWKKSAILETVAEYIQQLKTTNAKLIEENLQLKMKLSQTSGQMSATAHSYVFVPTLPQLSSAQQISTLMYSCIQ